VRMTEGTTPSRSPTHPMTSLPAAPPANDSDRPRPMVGRSAPLSRKQEGQEDHEAGSAPGRRRCGWRTAASRPRPILPRDRLGVGRPGRRLCRRKRGQDDAAPAGRRALRFTISRLLPGPTSRRSPETRRGSAILRGRR
jgi:hypothetical protein